jgi:hypothetical protein
MDPAVLLQIVELGISEIVPVEQLVVKLKDYFTLNPNVKISIQNLASEAIQADDDELTAIAAWQTAHGLPVTVQPTATSAPAPVAQMPSPAPAPAQTPTSSADGSQSAAAPGGATAGSAPDAAAAAPAPAPAAAGNPGATGDHGEIGDTGTNKPAST